MGLSQPWCANRTKPNGNDKFVLCDDGLQRRIPIIEPQICLLADALPRQGDIEHLIGNAIDVAVASNFIKTVMEVL